MTDNSKNIIETLLGNEVNKSIIESLEVVFELVPYMGKVISMVKMNRLVKRINKLEDRIKLMSLAMNESTNEILNEFIRKKAFPIFINELLEEHEDEKIDFIMYGIEYIYENDIREENKILIYYDVLRELRTDELKRLYQFTYSYQEKSFGNDKNVFKENPNQEMYQETQGYQSYIDNHLEKLNLIDLGYKHKIDEVYNYIEEKERMAGLIKSSPFGFDYINPKISLTDFGKNFIRFFDIEIRIQYLIKDIS